MVYVQLGLGHRHDRSRLHAWLAISGLASAQSCALCRLRRSSWGSAYGSLSPRPHTSRCNALSCTIFVKDLFRYLSANSVTEERVLHSMCFLG